MKNLIKCDFLKKKKKSSKKQSHNEKPVFALSNIADLLKV